MDGTEERKDTSGETQDSSSETRETSKEPETLTRDQAIKMRDDALSAAGRNAKTISDKTAEAERILVDANKLRTEAQAEQERWQKDRDEAAREAVKDDPEALKSLETRQWQRNEATKLAKERAELDERETKHKEGLEKADKVTKELSARDIASKHNVDVESLIKFTDGSTEAMEELARQLPKKGQTPPLKTDSSTTIGSGQMPDTAKGKMQAGWDKLHK